MFHIKSVACLAAALCISYTSHSFAESKMAGKMDAPPANVDASMHGKMSREDTMKMIDEAIASNDAGKMKMALEKMKDSMAAKTNMLAGDKMAGDKMDSKDAMKPAGKM